MIIFEQRMPLSGKFDAERSRLFLWVRDSTGPDSSREKISDVRSDDMSEQDSIRIFSRKSRAKRHKDKKALQFLKNYISTLRKLRRRLEKAVSSKRVNQEEARFTSLQAWKPILAIVDSCWERKLQSQSARDGMGVEKRRRWSRFVVWRRHQVPLWIGRPVLQPQGREVAVQDRGGWAWEIYQKVREDRGGLP